MKKPMGSWHHLLWGDTLSIFDLQWLFLHIRIWGGLPNFASEGYVVFISYLVRDHQSPSSSCFYEVSVHRVKTVHPGPRISHLSVGNKQNLFFISCLSFIHFVISDHYLGGGVKWKNKWYWRPLWLHGGHCAMAECIQHLGRRPALCRLGAASSCSTVPLLDRLLLLGLLCKLLVISSVFSRGSFLSLRMRPLFSHPTISSWTASSTTAVSITKYAHEFLTLGSLFWAPDGHILLILPTRYICFGLNYPRLCLAPKLSHNSHLLLLPGTQFVQD